MEEQPTKVCHHCKIEKPIYNFCKDKSRKDGIEDKCKECKRLWRLQNSGLQNIYSKTYQAKNAEANENKSDEYIDYLQKQGYFITKDAQRKNYRFNLDIKPWKGHLYKIGVVSDTHLGSRYQQLSHLHRFYKICQEENIREIFHCGDILDGQKVYKGHEYELFSHGVDAQVDYVTENYPDHNDITTYFICGNHDESHYKLSGVDVGLQIAKERTDMKYKGFYGAYFNIRGVNIYLHHGQGSVAYARSYKAQKLVEQLSPENKPNMLFLGHYHVGCHLPMYRNVYLWQMPCFQSQTPYLLTRGLEPEIMGLIISFRISDGKPYAFEEKKICFHEVVKDDY